MRKVLIVTQMTPVVKLKVKSLTSKDAQEGTLFSRRLLEAQLYQLLAVKRRVHYLLLFVLDLRL